ncbi:MAG: TAXI family TRAP transporter solute-binding subunit [Rhodobacteraceae bacterium]|nr:TAXI family TRAP transporter solute-binding subunit [Paracoccaceae bacterium]MBR9821038.1 TAXI family TRAP transporter solute-binding subunit [Paracoccaceae bacterium]
MSLNRRALVKHAMACALAGITMFGSAAQAQETARIGASQVGGVGYVIAVGISQLLQQHEGISSTVEPVGGSVASMFSLQAGKIDAALTNAIAASDLANGEGRFAERGATDIGLLALGQSSYRQVVVRAGAGIESAADLEGRTIVGIRPALPEVEQITHALLTAHGVDPASVNIVATTNTNEAVDALNIGTVDAAVVPGGAGASYLKQLAADGKIEFLDIAPDVAEAMLAEMHPALGVAMLPAGTYEGQANEVPVFDVPVYLVASAEMDADTAYGIVSAIFDNFDEFKTFHATAAEWRLPSDPKIPLHPGAARYLEEHGGS